MLSQKVPCSNSSFPPLTNRGQKGSLRHPILATGDLPAVLFKELKDISGKRDPTEQKETY